MKDSLSHIISNPVVDVGTNMIERSFDTSPDNIYGLLVAFLMFGVFVCFYMYIKMSKKAMDNSSAAMEQLVSLNKETVETFNQVNAVLISINEKNEQHHAKTLSSFKENLNEKYFDKVRTQIAVPVINEIKENRVAIEKSHERITQRLDIIEAKF